MSYREEIYIEKGIIEKTKYHTYRLGGKKTRIENYQPSPKALQEWNARKAEKKLYRTIYSNFQRNDLYITLTYRKEPTYEEAKKNISNFIRRLKRRYAKAGKELKYIYTTEYRGKRIHHHLLCSAGLTRKEVEEIWGKGMISHYAFQYFDGGFEDAKRLAAYFVKEALPAVREGLQKFRWIGSKNLKKPRILYRTIKSKRWKEQPLPPRGYFRDEVINDVNIEGYPYQFARFIKLSEVTSIEQVVEALEGR